MDSKFQIHFVKILLGWLKTMYPLKTLIKKEGPGGFSKNSPQQMIPPGILKKTVNNEI